MSNNNNIFLICGNSRSGKTSFSKFIKNKSDKKLINTGMESLLALHSSRIILKKEKINLELINYFYSRRFEGKDRNLNLSLCDYFDQNELNKYIKNFDFKYRNLSDNIVDFLINYSNTSQKDIFFLDLNFEFYIDKYFNKYKNVNILYFTRNLCEILREVTLFRDLSKAGVAEKNILEKIYFNYFFSKKIIKHLSKNYNTYFLNYNEILLKKNNDLIKLSNDFFSEINFDDLFQSNNKSQMKIQEDIETYIQALSKFNNKIFTKNIYKLRITFILKYYIIYFLYLVKKDKIGFFISLFTNKKNFIAQFFNFSKKIIIDNT
tara:strand:+ start:82 stop:1041 length:960 start_codon:yes stop_codon:yes gene_type:complete